MAQYIIPATFADDTWFVSGLSPNITIRQWDELNSIYVEVINDTMTDMWIWDYMYVFENYDKYKLYIYKIDGMSDTVTNRYFSWTNELDYYSNKVDFWSQIRGAYVNMDKNIIKSILKELIPRLDELYKKEVDFSNVITILDEIKSKDVIVSDNSEIIDKLDDISNKDYNSEIIEVMEKNDTKWMKVISNLVQQNNQSQETISELKDYIEKFMLRWDRKNDPDFQRMMRKEKKKELSLINDPDFISLIEDDS